MPEVMEQERAQAPAGRLLRLSPADRRGSREVSRDLRPEDVERILLAANQGDQQEQAKLAAEILEKDWDIAQAIQTRTAAVLGTPWRLEPADDSPRATEVAAFAEAELRRIPGAPAEGLESLGEAFGSLLSAYLPGFAVCEIVWEAGGRGVRGFQFVPQHHFTFGEGFLPRLVRAGEDPWELPAQRFVVHRYRHRPGDPARGGLIRPLAWLYCCKRLGLHDWLRYIEKFGMPFLLARLDERVWEQERHQVARLVRNFGSDGGGVFSKGVELELVQNRFADAKGELFGEFLAYAERAVARLVLGQTSTSDSRHSNRAIAEVHELVRQDLRQDDCAALAETLRAQLVAPLVAYNFGPRTPVPRMRFLTAVERDLEREARVLRTLAEAGYRLRDTTDLEKRFGYALERAE